jgi:hypothetical protein
LLQFRLRQSSLSFCLSFPLFPLSASRRRELRPNFEVRYGAHDELSVDLSEDYVFTDAIGNVLAADSELNAALFFLLPAPGVDLAPEPAPHVAGYLKCDFVAFPVHVRHLGVTLTLGTLARHSPLSLVKWVYARQAPNAQGEAALTCALSYRGERLGDSEVLANVPFELDDPTLTGHLRVRVEDHECGAQAYVHVAEYDSVRELKNRFGQRAHRFVYVGSKIQFKVRLEEARRWSVGALWSLF